MPPGASLPAPRRDVLECNVDAVHLQFEAAVVTGDQIHSVQYRAGKAVKVSRHMPPTRFATQGAGQELTRSESLLSRGKKEVRRDRI